jgi:prevent-host-death family protein
MTIWQTHEAKGKLSELIDRAHTEGPQINTRRGIQVAVVLSLSQYKRLAANPMRMGEFFMNSPLRNSKIKIERDSSTILRGIEQ